MALGLTACAHRSPEANIPTASELAVSDPELTPRSAFHCASGQDLATQFDVSEGQLSLGIDNTLVRLDQVPAGSGSKFSNGHVTFWNKGNLAMLEVDGVRTDCEEVLSR